MEGDCLSSATLVLMVNSRVHSRWHRDDGEVHDYLLELTGIGVDEGWDIAQADV